MPDDSADRQTDESHGTDSRSDTPVPGGGDHLASDRERAAASVAGEASGVSSQSVGGPSVSPPVRGDRR